jgi:UDP-N-acetylglucosamine--N-acetylmuramyl-(pentapeptide) pyrophosphoryl-undecaprenol N-acetylglucosamine transferase
VRERPYPEAPAGGRINLLIIGGSQGARVFGEVIPAGIALLPQTLRARLDVVHQVREEQLAAAKQAYKKAGVNAEAAPFFADMGQRLGAAHLVISRAGASSVTELQVAGRPAILVPFAAAADDHQTANAEGLTSVGAADVFTEAEFQPAPLAALLERRLADPHGLAVRAAAARAAAKPEAAKSLADLAESIAL